VNDKCESSYVETIAYIRICVDKQRKVTEGINRYCPSLYPAKYDEILTTEMHCSLRNCVNCTNCTEPNEISRREKKAKDMDRDRFREVRLGTVISGRTMKYF
jgi:hypothetical protein